MPNIPYFHCELIDLRSSEAFALAQTNETAYAATNRATLSAERDRLRQQLAQLREAAAV